MKKVTMLALLFAVTAFVTAGCAKKETGTATTGTAEPKAAAPAAGGIGVPECEEYLAKFEKCLPKIPGDAQAAMKSALDQTREGWKQAAATPEGKSQLSMACKITMDASRQDMTAYGCEW